MSLLRTLNGLLASVGSVFSHLLLLVIRLYWGWNFFLTGKGKLTHVHDVSENFAKWGVPHPVLNVYLAGSTEMVGGLLLLSGLLSRFASVALFGVMCVAYLTADRESLNAIFSNTDKFLYADPFLFMYAVLVVFAFGPGLISLDALLFREKKP